MMGNAVKSTRCTEAVLLLLAEERNWLTFDQIHESIQPPGGYWVERSTRHAIKLLKDAGLIRERAGRSIGHYGRLPGQYRARPLILKAFNPNRAEVRFTWEVSHAV